MKWLFFGMLVLECSHLLSQNLLLSTDPHSISSMDFENLPSIEWKFKTGRPIFATPVIKQNVVFVGGLDSTLYALDLVNGKLKWKFKTGGQIRSTVTVQGDQVFLYSGDATLYSLNKTSGKVSWSFKTKGGILGDRRHDFADYFQSTPVCDKSRIFFGSGDGVVYAVDASNGKLIWTFRADDIVHATPAVYKDRLVIGSFDGNVYALNKENGNLLWKFKTVGQRYFPKGEVQGSPVIADDLVYVGARDYNFYAIDMMDGYCHWNKSFPSGWAMAATPADSVIYLGTSDDRMLLALDAKTGQEQWKTDVKFNIFGAASITASMVYVGTLMGKVYGIDRKNGNIKWVFTTDSYTSNHLTYFKPDDTFRNDISKIIKSPADFIEMEYNLGAIFSTPVICNSFMLISSTDGNLYCLKR